jgi:LuxR family maltose regulon positive regulatory protein
MPTPLLTTKLFVPLPHQKLIIRPHLLAHLNEGLPRKLTLVSAAAGFGKTTLVSTWVRESHRPIAWLSLDEGDNDPTRFLTYLVTALQTIVPTIGAGIVQVLQAPQPPSHEAVLTLVLNELASLPEPALLVLDDYHLIDAQPIHDALTFLLTHLPPQVHLVIATREDPPLPLARLRGRNQLTELRVADLRFTRPEVARFFREVMGTELSADNIAALESRTEGWIAGLQLAALSMQGLADPTAFIRSFTGSHRFILDYLMEEVLQQQPAAVQNFLLHTSILERFCAPLCEAVLRDSTLSGQPMLDTIEQANLFIVPLDSERQWYRYHHLFGDLLRQRLQHSTDVAELHRRAAQWYETNGFDIEAFDHAIAANDLPHAIQLVEGGSKGMPLHFRGGVFPVLQWLESLPPTVLDANPALWVMYASALLFVNKIPAVIPTLQAAEIALAPQEPNEKNRDMIGHIASIRATLAVTQHDIEAIITQSRRALDYLHPNNLPVRTATTWTMGYAYYLQGDRAAAARAYTEALAISKSIGHIIITVMTTLGIGRIQEEDTRLYEAAETYQRFLQMLGEPPLPLACQAHLGLARIYYEWNELEKAWHHAHESLRLARQLDRTDRAVACELFLAHLHFVQGDFPAATAIVTRAEQFTRQHGFVHRIPDIVAMQVRLLLQQGEPERALALTEQHELPLSQARVHLAHGNDASALALLESVRHHYQTKGWADERLKAIVLTAMIHYQQGNKAQALELLVEAMALAEPGGYIRLFMDEGLPMAHLLREGIAEGMLPPYAEKLLTLLESEMATVPAKAVPRFQPLIEPLSQRELEILHLIANGLSNDEIGNRLFLALNTVKGHNRNIFGKLHVQRRTEAVARARDLGLL